MWIWHDEEGGEPDYALPAFENYDNSQWVKWNIEPLGELNSHPQEIVDNIADKGHLVPVHGSEDMAIFENRFEDHVCWQVLKAGHRTLSSKEEGMTNDTWYTGPGILQSTMEGDYPSHMLIAHTPVDDGLVKVWYGLLVKSPNEKPTEADISIAREYEKAGLDAFAQDFEIWADKRPCLSPMMVKGDGPFDKVRIWYKQFFNARERASDFQKRVNGHYISKGTSRDPWEDAA